MPMRRTLANRSPAFGVQISDHPGQDRDHRAPRDPQQAAHRGLGRVAHQPCRLVVEGAGMPRAVAGPRHRRHDHPVRRAASPAARPPPQTPAPGPDPACATAAAPPPRRSRDTDADTLPHRLRAPRRTRTEAITASLVLVEIHRLDHRCPRSKPEPIDLPNARRSPRLESNRSRQPET